MVRKILFGILASLLLIVNVAFAATVQMTWQAPTAYTDGTTLPLSGITAYNIYYGASPAAMTTKLALPIMAAWPSLSTMSYTVNNVGAGTWYFAVSCSVGTAESGFSNIVSKTIVLVPNAPSNLIIPGGVNYV